VTDLARVARASMRWVLVLVLAACSPNAGGENGSAGEGSAGADGDAAAGASSGPGPGGDTSSSCGGDPGLADACTALCDAFMSSGCSLMDLSVRDVYRLYVNDSDDNCVEECVAGDVRQDSVPDAPTKCGPALSAYVERAAQNTCINADPSKNFYGQWDYKGLDAEGSALIECGQECLDLPTCDPSTCNGSMSAGDVFCTWACSGRVCEQTCN
jgi:hypothetical protein